MGDAASIQHGRRRRFNRQMGVLRMLSAERAAPDAAEKDAPFCRLTLDRVQLLGAPEPLEQFCRFVFPPAQR